MDSKCRGTPLKHRLHRPKQTHSEKFFSSSSQEMVYITDSANGPKVLLGCTICNNKGTEKSNWMASWLKGCFPMKLEDRVACRIDQDGEATPGLKVSDRFYHHLLQVSVTSEYMQKRL